MHQTCVSFFFVNKRAQEGRELEWRKRHNEELNDLYHSSNIARFIKPTRLRWAGHIARMEGSKNSFKILIRKPLDEMLLDRWEVNFGMELTEEESKGN